VAVPAGRDAAGFAALAQPLSVIADAYLVLELRRLLESGHV
jgi:hypothetical protein